MSMHVGKGDNLPTFRLVTMGFAMFLCFISVAKDIFVHSWAEIVASG